MIIHYDDVKSTIDNWQDNKKSYRRLRPKLLQVNIIYSKFTINLFFLIDLDTRTTYDS